MESRGKGNKVKEGERRIESEEGEGEMRVKSMMISGTRTYLDLSFLFIPPESFWDGMSLLSSSCRSLIILSTSSCIFLPCTPCKYMITCVRYIQVHVCCLVECYALLVSGDAHAKLEAHIALQYNLYYCAMPVTYSKIDLLTRLGGLAPFAN